MRELAEIFYNEAISEHKEISKPIMIDFLVSFVDYLPVESLIFESLLRFEQLEENQCYLMSEEMKHNIVSLFAEFATTSLYELQQADKLDDETYEIMGNGFRQDFDKLLKTFLNYEW